jgi:hypothetical protein
MPGPHASPSPLNAFEGKGNIYFTPTGGTRRHLGNAPSLTTTPDFQTRELMSHMAGVATTYREDTVSAGLNVAVRLNEVTLENLSLFYFGTITGTAPYRTFKILSTYSLRGKLELEGTNAIGNRFKLEIPTVSLIPTGTFDWIGDDYAELELSGKALADPVDGTFGSIDEFGYEGEAYVPEGD